MDKAEMATGGIDEYEDEDDHDDTCAHRDVYEYLSPSEEAISFRGKFCSRWGKQGDKITVGRS